MRDAYTIRSALRSNIKPDNFYPDAILSFFWKISSEFFQKYKRPITIEALCIEIEKKLQDASYQNGNAVFIDKVLELVDFIYSYHKNGELVQGYGIELLQRYFSEKFQSTLPSLVETEPSAALDVLNKIFRKASIQNFKEVNIFSDEGLDLLVSPEYFPSGVDFVDRLLGGGFKRECLYLLLGGSGCYKTTLALQIGILFAYTNPSNKTLFLTYEQGLQGEITRKAYASLCENRPENMTKEAIKKGLVSNAERLNEIKDRFIAIDCTEPGVPATKELIEEAAQNNFDLVVLDWLGAFVDRCDGLYEKSEEAKYRHMMGYLLDVARSTKTAILVLHQIAPGLLGAPNRKPTWQDAQGCKGLAFYCNTVFSLGTVDERSRCQWFVASKSRDRFPSNEIIVFDEARSRLVCVTDQFIPVKGRLRKGQYFVPKKDA